MGEYPLDFDTCRHRRFCADCSCLLYLFSMTLSHFIEQLQELERNGCGHYLVQVDLSTEFRERFDEVVEIIRQQDNTVSILIE